MSTDAILPKFLTGSEYSPQEALGGPLPLAHCYLGIQSHLGVQAARESIEARIRLGTKISTDPVYSNPAVQGASRRVIADLLQSAPENVTLTGNTNEGLQIIKQAMELTANDKVLLYRYDYLDVKTPFVPRDECLPDARAVYFEGSLDEGGRPTGFSLGEIEEALLTHKPRLMVISHIQFPNAFTTDGKQIVELCRKVGTKIVIDIAQSFCVFPFFPHEVGCDAAVTPLSKWAGGLRGSGFLWTSPEFRAELKIPRLSSAAMPTADFTSHVESEPIIGTGKMFEVSTLATDSVWVTTLAMLKEKRDLGVENIAERVLWLHEMIINEFAGTPEFEKFVPPNGTPGSFLAFRMTGNLVGREPEFAAYLREEHNIDVTARAGYLRLAPHHSCDPDLLRTKLRVILSEAGKF